MDRREMTRFWQRALLPDREMTPIEVEFVMAAMKARTPDFDPASPHSRWDGGSDVERMARLVEKEPSLLQSVGEALTSIIVAVEGCAPALEFLPIPKNSSAGKSYRCAPTSAKARPPASLGSVSLASISQYRLRDAAAVTFRSACPPNTPARR